MTNEHTHDDETPSGGTLSQTDRMLTILALTANEHGSQFAVTLTSRGLVISGLLVGRDEWLDVMSANVASSGGSATELLTELFDQSKISAVREADPDWVESFVHLIDARFVVDSQLNLPPVPWRGHLNAIDGWSLGSFKP